MTVPSSSLAQTPLYAASQALGARMTEFSGWEMPVQYAGISHEHTAVRTAAGMFDISHMGKFRLRGANVLSQLQPLVPSDLARVPLGAAQYTVLLNPAGGIIDDLIFYNQGVDADGMQCWVAIVNAATTEKDKAWLLQHLDTQQIEFVDDSRQFVLLAVQGPDALRQLQPHVATDLSPIPAFGHVTSDVLGAPGFLARTGYTGEDGFEVMVPPETGIALWHTLAETGVQPCGLGARDTLRLEAAMALYGQDIDDTTSPLEAGLGWLVHWDKGDFMGRTVLEQQKQSGVTRRLVGLQMEGRNIARHGYPVRDQDQVVGEVTSGTLSPTLGRAIALAYVPPTLATPGHAIQVEIRGKSYPGAIVKKPFYRRPK